MLCYVVLLQELIEAVVEALGLHTLPVRVPSLPESARRDWAARLDVRLHVQHESALRGEVHAITRDGLDVLEL